MPFEIVRQDITKMSVDAIVNAANEQLLPGGGVCGAIFAAAGHEDLLTACEKIGHCATGQAVMTPGFRLSAPHIIHTVGPVWRGGRQGEEQLLRQSYLSALSLALSHQLTSIAFPLISSGLYGFPKDRALQAALGAISSFLSEHDMLIYLVVFDRESFQLSDVLFKSITSYIDDNYADSYARRSRRISQDQALYSLEMENDMADAASRPERRDDYPAYAISSPYTVGLEPKETFSQMLLSLITSQGLTDPDVYKRANIDRKLFSKIRSNPLYQPGKKTALALALALQLDLELTCDLLSRAGYALSPSSRFDLIIRYFIDQRHYDIFDINATLFKFEGETLS